MAIQFRLRFVFGLATHLGLISASFGGSIGCTWEMVADPQIQQSSDSAADDKAIIVGGINWQEVTTLPDGSAERANSRAVAYLDLPSEGARCTAFLIAPDVIMTNHHCIPTASAARGARALFRYEAGGPVDDVGYDCSTFLGNDSTLDYALLQCAGRPGDTYGVVELDGGTVAANAGIYAIHQNCDYYADPSCAPTKKYSPGRITSTASGELSHDADTLGGSSGSPVFSRVTQKVVGLHHLGLNNDGSGRGSENRAVPMSRILPTLLARYPGIQLGGRAPADVPAVDQQAPSPSTTAPDGYEPNDTVPGAVSVQLPFSSVDARIEARRQGADVDTFTFVADGATHTVELAFRHAAGDLDLYILDAKGTEIARSNGTTDTESVSLAFPAGPIVVAVVGYSGATGAYSLTIR